MCDTVMFLIKWIYYYYIGDDDDNGGGGDYDSDGIDDGDSCFNVWLLTCE
jgi:hypothetical protein